MLKIAALLVADRTISNNSNKFRPDLSQMLSATDIPLFALPMKMKSFFGEETV
jgi:hypothetical protein